MFKFQYIGYIENANQSYKLQKTNPFSHKRTKQMIANQIYDYKTPSYESVPSATAPYESTQSVVDTPQQLPRTLPKLQYKLLSLFYEDYVVFGIAQSDRSLKELAFRFKRSEETISRACSCLKQLGLLTDKHGGSTNKLRWITYEGVSYLDNKPSSQTSSQIDPIPYIYLSEEKREKDLDLICEEQICGQDDISDLVLKEPLEEALERLEEVFIAHSIPVLFRNQIKNTLRKSRMGPVRSEMLVRRVIALHMKRRPIANLRNYLLGAIHNEERQVRDLKEIFKNKPVTVKLYAEQKETWNDYS